MKFIIYKDKYDYRQIHIWARESETHASHILPRVKDEGSFLASGNFYQNSRNGYIKIELEKDQLLIMPYSELTVGDIEECILCALLCKQKDLAIETLLLNTTMLQSLKENTR